MKNLAVGCHNFLPGRGYFPSHRAHYHISDNILLGDMHIKLCELNTADMNMMSILVYQEYWKHL